MIHGCRWNERLKSKTEGCTLLGYTGFHGELGHLPRGYRYDIYVQVNTHWKDIHKSIGVMKY